MTTWPLSLTTRTPECECALSRFFSFVSAVSHLAPTHRGSSLVFVLHVIHMCSWSERLSSTLLSSFTSRTSCRTLSTSTRTWRSKTTLTCALRTTRVWTCMTSSTSAQVMSPTASTSRRLPSSPTQSSWTRRRSSAARSLPWTPTTMTLHSRVCLTKLTEYMAITLNEKTHLSVCRRQCPTERDDLLGTERGDLLSILARKHILGLCSTTEGADSCRVPGKNQQTRISSRLRQKKYTKTGWNCWISTRRTSLRLSWRRSTERSTASSSTVIAAKFGITWSSPKKSHRNGRVKEVSEFHLRHHCKTRVRINCMINFKRFSRCWINTKWKFPRYQSASVIPTSSNSWSNVMPFFRSAGPQRRAAKHLGHTWYVQKRFCKSRCVIISTLSTRIESMELIEEPLHTSTVEKSERPEQNRDMRCQFGPSASESVIFSGGDSSKNFGADQQRLQISDLHFVMFPTPATFACWKIRFKTEVCSCSQFPTEAVYWIKEVELVDSVDELRSSSSIRGIPMPKFRSTWCENCFSTE